MITEEQYVEDCLRNGVRGHCHDGVWWREPYPLYAKPMFEFRQLVPGSARPAWRKSLLGFSHHVPEPGMGNLRAPYMVLEGDALRGYGLESLPGKKRNQVRKGLKHFEVRRIEDVEPHLEEIRAIYVSQSMRHAEHHERPETPPEFYERHAEEWRDRERRYLGTCGREIWGAFADGRLAGFIVSPEIAGVRLIEKAKYHTDFLPLNVGDALYYAVLEAAGRSGTCRRVINPGIRAGRLSRYKEQFLFRHVELPVYASASGIVRLGRALTGLPARWRSPGKETEST